jgi:hypothetical protein
MCAPVSFGSSAFKGIGDLMAEGRARSEAAKTNAFMSPRGDDGITQQAQQLPPGRFFGNTSSPMANAMVGLAMAKGNQMGYQSPSINMSNSNKTGRVIS